MNRLKTVIVLAAMLPSVVAAQQAAPLRQIPSEAARLHAKFAARLQPGVRLWLLDQAGRLREGRADENALRAAIQARFGRQLSLGSGDVDTEAVAFLVLMQATHDADKDLKVLMEEAAAMTAAKQKLGNLIEKVNRDVAQSANKRATDTCVPPQCGGYLMATREAAIALSRVRMTLVAREPANIQQLGALNYDLKRQLDSLSEMSNLVTLRLQQAMDRRSRFISTLSNIMKKISTTQETLIRNLK